MTSFSLDIKMPLKISADNNMWAYGAVHFTLQRKWKQEGETGAGGDGRASYINFKTIANSFRQLGMVAF